MIKIQNRKELQLQVLVDSRCTYTGINRQLVKKEKIKTKPANISFEVFSTDSIKNGEVIRFALLEVKIYRYKEQIDVAVTDLNGMDIFLGHNWLVKYNPEVNWKKGIIWFVRCPRIYRIKHQDIIFIQDKKSTENGHTR